jgi:hypothetical protein
MLRVLSIERDMCSRIALYPWKRVYCKKEGSEKEVVQPNTDAAVGL